MKNIFLHIVLFIAVLNVSAQQQTPILSWEKQLANVQNVTRVIQNKAGNVFILGEKTKEGYIAEMRPNGTFVFEKGINPNRKFGCYEPMNVVESKDGNGYFICGRSCKPSKNMSQNDVITLTRIDVKGNVLWHFGLDETDGSDVDVVEDTELAQIYMAASTVSGFQVVCMETPRNNVQSQIPTIVWKRTFESDGSANRLVLTKDKKLLVSGFQYTDPYLTGLLKCLNTEGSVLWEKRYEKSVFLDLKVTSDEHIWLSGYAQTAKNGNDMLLLELDSSGNDLSNSFKLGGTGLDVARSFARDEDNNFYLIGRSTSQTRSDRFDDMCVYKINPKGKQLWQRPFYFGKGETDIAHTGVILRDGRFLMGGVSNEKGQLIMLDKVFEPKKNDLKEHVPPSVQTETQSPLTVTWLSPNPLKSGLQFDVTTEQFPIEIQAKSTQPLAKEQFAVLLNGKPLGIKFDNVKIKKSPNDKAGDYTFFWENSVALPVGKNTVEVVVTNAAGTARTTVLEPNFIEKPNLYLLSVGIPSDLAYTTNDAADIVTAFKTQEGGLFQRVFIDSLYSKSNTTGSTLIQRIGYLKDFQTIRSHDVVIVFISSHGFVDGANLDNFYIQPSDVVGQYARACVNFKTDVRDVLQQIKAKQLILIDACQSGGIKGDETEKINNAITKLLNAETGLRCISSSQANEKSHEDAAWKNGAFTKAIKEAFANEKAETTEGVRSANTNGDAWLTLRELSAFLKIRVPFMVNAVKGAIQHPQAFNIDDLDDFPIFVYPQQHKE